MRSSLGVFFIALVLATVSGCARLANEGEACSSPSISESVYSDGYGGACATGLICAPDHATTAAYTDPNRASCRTACASSTECAEGFTCRGVSGAEFRQACLPVAN